MFDSASRGLAWFRRVRVWRIAVVVLAVGCLTAGFSTLSAGDIFVTAEGARPDYVKRLESSFGAPSQSGFGSTVLFAPARSDAGLEDLALAAYRHFVGDLWDKWGEAAWMGPWKRIHERTGPQNIVAELGQLDDPQASSSAEMILDVVTDPAAGRAALSGAFDDAAVDEMLVFSIGDGAAMSGLLVAARRTNGDATVLVFLMD